MRSFGLIGYPLSHSFSENYFAEKFQREKIHDAVYKNFPLENIQQLPQLVNGHTNLFGLNITIPHKETVMDFLDETDASAKNIGAVNVLKIQNGKIKGFNTDHIGFLRSLKPLLQTHHRKALILGTGGSSKAVSYILNLLNIQYKYVSRNTIKNGFVYSELNAEILNEYLLLINTTPLGMFPENDVCPPLPYEYLISKHLLFDLIYNPAETLFLQKGKAQGATTKNGLEMLQIQAEESWKIWNRFC